MRPQLREYIVIRTVHFCWFIPIDEVWQHSVSAMLGLQFVGKNRVRPGGPNVPLTPPDMRTTSQEMVIVSSTPLHTYIMTGSEDQHMAVHTAILQHDKC